MASAAGMMTAGSEAFPETVARIDTKSYGEGAKKVTVLDGLVLRFADGRFNVLIGPSGCGKTTALRIVAGLDRQFAGVLDPALAAARMGLVFQDPRLLQWRNVARNVALAARERTATEISAMLDAVGLQGMEDRFPSQLSLGQARRVALARAFAVRPDLLLLDEPFVSLDETTAQRLRGLLLDLWASEPATIVMVTHNVREAIALADRLIVLTHRPSRVAGVIDLSEPQVDRDAAAVEKVAIELQRRFPGLIAV